MKQNQRSTELGFTLVELLVVISIMGFAFVIVLVGLNQQQITRSTPIAQNEMVTNMRKVQSYMLSSRNIGSKPAKYYTIRLSTNPSDNSKYTINAIDSDYAYSSNIETINLTNNVVVKQMALLSGAVTNGTYAVTTPVTSGCAQVAFSAPFGKMYIDTINCDSSFITVTKNPVELIKRADKTLEVTLSNSRGGTDKKIILYGFSGRILGQ